MPSRAMEKRVAPAVKARATARARATTKPSTAANTDPCENGRNSPEDDVHRDLRLLQSILEPPIKTVATKTQAKRPRAQTASTASRSVKIPNSEKPNEEYGGSDTTQRSLCRTNSAPSAHEQKKLAMNSFNQNLKVLTAIVKKRQENRLRSQQVKPLDKDKVQEHKSLPHVPSSEESSPDDVTTAHAECACAALDVLRQNMSNGDVSRDVRVKRERGAVLLLDKLISLDLKDLAHLQATKIYEHHWVQKDVDGRQPNGTSRKADLSCLLRREEAITDEAHFEMTCLFQSQVLRLAILQGTTSVTRAFHSAVGTDVSGSPCNIILTGLNANLVSRDKAGENLRTIAQALTKLYSAVMKTSKDMASSSSILAFSLLAEAQLHKIASWIALDHKSELELEIWTVLERATKQLWQARSEKGLERYGAIKQAVERVHGQLLKNNFKSEVPPSLAELLASLAENHDDTETAIRLLINLSCNSDGIHRLKFLCQIASIQLGKPGLQSSSLETIHSVVEYLTKNTNADLMITAQQLLTIVQLRRICSERLSAISEAVTHIDATENQINASCLRLLLHIPRFLANVLGAESLTDGKVERSLRLAILKSVEAVSDAESYASIAPQSVFEEYLDGLEHCTNILKEFIFSTAQETQEDPQAIVLVALKIKVSNVLWRAHSSPQMTSQDRSLAIHYAQKSISCLDCLSIEDLRKAALGPRLEKLARMMLDVDQIDSAQHVLKQAIDHYLATGALADAVEASLSTQSSNVWSDTDSLSYQLGRTINAYNSLAHKKQGGVTDVALNIYDENGLPEIHRATLLELQIHHLLRQPLSTTAYELLLEKARVVLNLTSSPQYHIWRLRFTSMFAHKALEVHDSPNQETSSLFELLAAVLSDASDPPSMFLKSYQVALQGLVILQKSLLTGNLLSNMDQEVLSDLQKVILGCSDVKTLNENVDDVSVLIYVLELIRSRAFALGSYRIAVLCLSVQIHLTEIGLSPSSEELPSLFVELARSQIALSDFASAAVSLQAAETRSSARKSTKENSVEFHLSSAELQLAFSDFKSCSSLLRQAAKSFAKQWQGMESLSSSKQIERDAMLAKGAILASQLAFLQGELPLANQYARQAVKISISIWFALQKRNSNRTNVKEDPTVLSLTQDLSKLNIESQQHAGSSRLSGPKFWPYVELYVSSIRQSVTVLSHTGLFEDALHHQKQLQKLVLTNAMLERACNPTPMLSALYAKAGQSKIAIQMLSQIRRRFDAKECPWTANELLSGAEAFAALGDVQSSLKLLQQVHVKVDILTHTDKPEESEGKQDKMPNKARRRPAKPKNVTDTKAEPHRTVTNRHSRETTSHDKIPGLQKFNLHDLRDEDRRRALIITFIGSVSEERKTENCTSTMSELCRSPKSVVQEIFAVARSTLAEAWKQLCADSMQSVLTDSAIALPSNNKSQHRRGRISFLQGREDGPELSPAKPFIPKPGSPSTKSLDLVSYKLEFALQLCSVLLRDRRQCCPMDMIQALSKMQTRISLLLTAMDSPFTISSTELVLKTSFAKDDSLAREMMIAEAENATRDRSSLLIWPDQIHSHPSNLTCVSGKQLTDLPQSWSILSLTLTDDHDELILSKTINGRSPFLVRIPLHRSNEGDGAEDFVFADARNEMRSIIDLANSSSHDVRGMGDKVARAAWHADREALDQRLKNLLANIELIWLGGFRGILDPYEIDQNQLENFSKILACSLDKHLPSRQKGGVGAKKVNVHDHIVEIFLGLGNPDEMDLDDAIMDLLYFVVDILRFNGETNAYDEIDWDAMLVDMLDALRAYHTSRPSQEPRHTILILDKELEIFPWECLPCLIGNPVSRMPSLGTILTRLDQIRMQSGDSEIFKVSKNQVRGSYVLNPSGDLSSTQDLFQPILTCSSNTTSAFTAIVNSRPDEAQFSKLLSTSDILLYFGHGSGAQFVRPRTIRNLPRCAVTFLFGCSSAKMMEYGAFESTGMPRAYILGGSPAVVGCLWDVTDREIDRVALKALGEWGLIDKADERVKEGLKKKGRKYKRGVNERAEQESSLRRKTLVEAVREGRDACTLKYLCGAAVVVYGIPVVLD